MNRDDIIRMAREAGCIPRRHPEYDNDVQVFAAPDVLERFANYIYAAGSSAEREECVMAVSNVLYGRDGCGEAIAAIRARGKE